MAGGLAVALTPEASVAAVPQVLAQSTILAAIRYAAGGATAGAVPEAVASLAKGALLAMRLSGLKLFAWCMFAAALVAGSVPVVISLAQAAGQRETRPGVAAATPGAIKTPRAALGSEEPSVAIAFQNTDRKESALLPYPNPYQPNGRKISGPPGSLTIHLGPLRFDDRRAAYEKTMTLIERPTIIATTTPQRDRILAYSTEQGGWQSYRIPVGVKFTPIASDNALALYLTGNSIAEVAVFSVRSGVWNKQMLKVPATDKLEPFMTPQIVLYGTGRWVYAYSAETNTWDALELGWDGEVSARLSAAENVLVEDVHSKELSIFAPRIGRWATIKTAE
jgi:hypothetical protein